MSTGTLEMWNHPFVRVLHPVLTVIRSGVGCGGRVRPYTREVRFRGPVSKGFRTYCRPPSRPVPSVHPYRPRNLDHQVWSGVPPHTTLEPTGSEVTEQLKRAPCVHVSVGVICKRCYCRLDSRKTRPPPRTHPTGVRRSGRLHRGLQVPVFVQ